MARVIEPMGCSFDQSTAGDAWTDRWQAMHCNRVLSSCQVGPLIKVCRSVLLCF